jgi:hypothetical protein
MTKIHWSAKLALFVLSVCSLSWFFAGCREIHQYGNWQSYLLLAGGTSLTVLLLFVQGYFIYMEEKSKGTLRKRIALFERINHWLNGNEPSPSVVSVDERKES